eukprot:CAMPEP_0180319714 /NCGR_PEP_ID=MMETSP0988-20121125/35160_1 /TAXON_ID=697907 /ORGANISM="non described non described, Strain CCMP2293" /LENGTH=106 /DNA_ID=CAMNT_0022305339 /DNA_START=123 /DNA_END=440 /DNA_ORIENTATION=-
MYAGSVSAMCAVVTATSFPGNAISNALLYAAASSLMSSCWERYASAMPFHAGAAAKNVPCPSTLCPGRGTPSAIAFADANEASIFSFFETSSRSPNAASNAGARKA